MSPVNIAELPNVLNMHGDSGSPFHLQKPPHLDGNRVDGWELTELFLLLGCEPHQKIQECCYFYLYLLNTMWPVLMDRYPLVIRSDQMLLRMLPQLLFPGDRQGQYLHPQQSISGEI